MKNASLTARLSSASCLLLSLVVLLVMGFPVVGQAAESLSIAPVERDLPSGARALLWPRAGSGTVLITIAVPAGSQDEPPDMAGLSHYLEHLLFDGFDDLDERGVTEAFEQRSAYVNGFTREQNTVFFALAPVEEAVASAQLLVGMLNRSNIVPATFQKERKVILEELAKDHTSPESLKEERLRGALWRGTPLEHPVGGFGETVAATNRETVVRYWEDRYRPSSWRVLITGDLPLEGLESVLQVFEHLPKSDVLPERDDPLSWQGWGEWMAVPMPEEKGAPGAMPSGMGGGMPAMGGMGRGADGAEGGTLVLVVAPGGDWNRTELDLVARWLGEAGGPLSSALTPQLAESVSVALIPHDPRDLLEIRLQAQPGIDAQDLLARLLGLLEAAKVGPADGDVLRISRAWQAERALTGQRLHYAAVFYGDALATARGPLREAVDPAEVAPESVRVAAARLLDECGACSRAAWIGEGGPVERTSLPQSIAPQEIQVESVFEEGPFASVVMVLANGLTLGILPENGGRVFGIHLLVADRSLREPEESPGIVDLIHRLLPAGTGLSGSRALDRRLTRAGIEVKAADASMIPFDDRYHIPDFSYVRLEGPAASFEEGLVLLAEMIMEPAWDEAGMESALSAHRASRKAGDRGGALASQRLYGALLGTENPLARPVSGPVDAQLPKADQVKAAWGRWPAGYFAPERIILTVASPLPVEQTLEIVEDLFGGGLDSSPQRGPYPQPKPSGGAVAVGDGSAPQMTLLWGRRLTVPDEDRAALLVAVNAMSDRMVALIREEEGLAYRLGAGLRVLPGGDWVVAARVGTRPENLDRVTELMHGISTDLAAEAVEQEMLTRFAARDRRSRMLRSLSAASRAYRLGRALYEGPASTLRVETADLIAVTQEQVQLAAQRYLGLKDMLLVISQ